MRVRRASWLAVLFTTLAACDVSESDLSQDGTEAQRRLRCTELREHLAEVRVAAVTVDREKHRRAISRALGDGFVETCLGYGEASIECGLAAADHATAAGCLASVTEE